MNHLIHIAAHARSLDEGLIIGPWLLLYPIDEVPTYCVVGEHWPREFLSFADALDYICADGQMVEISHVSV